MEKIAHRIADILVREKIISSSMFEIYQYGLLRMLEMGGVIIVAIMLCLCMNMVVEGIVFLSFFTITFLSGRNPSKEVLALFFAILSGIRISLSIRKIYAPR